MGETQMDEAPRRSAASSHDLRARVQRGALTRDEFRCTTQAMAPRIRPLGPCQFPIRSEVSRPWPGRMPVSRDSPRLEADVSCRRAGRPSIGARRGNWKSSSLSSNEFPQAVVDERLCWVLRYRCSAYVGSAAGAASARRQVLEVKISTARVLGSGPGDGGSGGGRPRSPVEVGADGAIADTMRHRATSRQDTRKDVRRSLRFAGGPPVRAPPPAHRRLRWLAACRHATPVDSATSGRQATGPTPARSPRSTRPADLEGQAGPGSRQGREVHAGRDGQN